MSQVPTSTTPDFQWQRQPDQAVWLWIALVFALFYCGEAVLFWQGLALAGPLLRLPLAVPWLYPLGYWAAFGYSIYRLERRFSRGTTSAAEARFQRWKSVLLTLVITVGVIGLGFSVMRGSGQTTLGHVALFLGLFIAAGVIGAWEINLGWLAAATVWLLTAAFLFLSPPDVDLIPAVHDEDIWVGAGTVAGMVAIGVLPLRIDRGSVASTTFH